MRCFQPPPETRFYAGVDLHARSLFLVVLDRLGHERFARNLPAAPAPFLQAVQPFRDGLVVGCECMHCWYWLADTCRDQGIPFALGHAWAMRAVHGSKTKCDRKDAEAIARLLKGGNFPLAYAYPHERRGLRDLLRTDVQAFKTRHHGDLHLGQVLFAKDDAFILDFEGEPERGLDERRRKTPAARDVAGLLRSVDYAATSAFERALLTWPDEHDRLLTALEHWGRQSVATFMATYREALTNPQLWPADTEQADRLLDFFLLEKAFYEIQYELANRPGWLRVPLMGLERILSKRTRT